MNRSERVTTGTWAELETPPTKGQLLTMHAENVMDGEYSWPEAVRMLAEDLELKPESAAVWLASEMLEIAKELRKRAR